MTRKDKTGTSSSNRRRGKYNKSVFQALTVITQFSIHMIVPIFLCSFLGIWVDNKAGTSYWVIILFFIGALAGFTNVYRLAKKIYDTDHSGKK